MITQQEIESLGWGFCSLKTMNLWRGGSRMDKVNVLRFHMPKERVVHHLAFYSYNSSFTIHSVYDLPDGSHHDMICFSGVLKNKAELEKILEQTIYSDL